jgi:DNA-binding NarL/FixJ family response regulator
VPPITVVVADDDPDLRAALVDTLTTDDFVVLGAVGTGGEAVAAVAVHRPDVALLDVRMPSGGPGAVSAVRRCSPDTAVVAISAHAGSGVVEQLAEAGASGFLVKGSRDLDVPGALRRVAAGEQLLPGARSSR